MCGIAGFVNGGSRPADRAIVERMTAAIAHRGPDGDGFFVDGPVALGHRRLAIIDPAGGAQPMANEDESVWITYNGELYDETARRPELLRRGHVYRTRADTESIVHGYEEAAEAPGPFFASLNGMFALAIWDGPRRRLILARDRFGQKPLFYAALPGGGLAFGSEPKALLGHPEVPRRLDRGGLARYLFYEYVPAPHSIWDGMRKLPPGSWLAWQDGSVRVERFWRPGPPDAEAAARWIRGEGAGRNGQAVSFSHATRRFWDSFREAVARHRRSDVPLGVFLSGGVDSSSVAAALCEVQPARSVQTFSIGFDEPSFDEGPYFRAVAKHLGTDHHERIFSATTVHELLPDVAAWLDEPFGDASILPTHLLSRFARESVTVVLGGDGADELLAGYPTFPAEGAARLFRRLPRPARALVGAAAGRLPVDHANFSLDFRVKQFLRGAAEPPPLAHQRWLGSFGGAEVAALLAGGDPVGVEAEHLRRAAALPLADDPLSRSLLLYQDTYLPDDILAKVDRASMATSLEVRAPFLDAELAEAVLALPPGYKMTRSRTKRLLKAAAADKLPATVLARAKKGFGIPVARLLRGPLAGLLDAKLGPDRLARQGLFRPEEVARRIAEHRAGVRDHRKPLWTLLMFQLWSDHWLGE